jgi:peptide deformylase
MSETFVIDTATSVVQEPVQLEPLPLYDENHPMLKQAIPEYDIPLPNVNMYKLIARLKMTMKLYGGVGLSANQCGVFQRVFVIGTDQFQIACINPKVVKFNAEPVKGNEGCLSFPGLFLNTSRCENVDVEFTDENGNTRTMTLEGITARCFLHELDHLNGIRFVEHVGPVALAQGRRKQSKIVKRVARKK